MMDFRTTEKYQHQAAMLANRVRKRYQHLRKRFARDNIEVFRLYDWDIPEIRAVVDWYAGHLVVGEYTRKQSTPEWLPMMAAAVADILEIPSDRVHRKARVAGKAGGKRYSRIDFTNKMIVVSERDLRFYVNPWDYVDTGLFSDHRNTRQMIRGMVAGKDVLNLFCYTGAFSCYAAKGGARSTVSVDRSQTAIDWVRQNLALNDIPRDNHRLVQAHVMEYLAKAQERGDRFDLAVVDPPSFYTTRSRGDHFDIVSEHPDLLDAVIALMRPGGILIFSTNHQDFSLHDALLDVTRIENITDQTIPEDYVRKRTPIHQCWKFTI